MDLARWRPLDPVRSWRFGADVAAAVTAVLGASLLLADARSRLAWGLVAGSALIAAAGRLADGTRLVTSRVGSLLQYLWAVGGIVAAGAFSVVLEGGPLRYAFVFAIAAVAAAATYPQVGQVPYHVLVLVVVAVSWASQPAGTGPAELLLFLGLLATLMYLVGSLSADIRRSSAEEARIRAMVDDRNRLLRLVGRAVSLDASRSLNVVVDAVIASGFEIANVGVVRDGVRHAVATRGIPGEIPPTPADSGIAGRALVEDRTIVVDDYAAEPARLPHRGDVRSAVATPVRVDGRVGGVLIGARTRPGMPTVDDVEMMEVLALHAGHALAAAQRFEEQQAAVARLRELDQMKRDFVSNVSHELRTPLTVVKGLARTLRTREESLDPARAAELLERINANTERLGAMLGGLLDFRRLESGQLRAQLRPVEVGALVRSVVARLGPVLERHRVSLEMPPSILAAADPTLVEHVLENLLGNVAKHTPAGTQVTVRVVPDVAGVLVAVRDDGPGIAEEEIPLLTRRYYRGTPPVTGAVEGAGVGLALVNDILEAHGTRLEVRSGAEGTTFGFRLRAPVEARP